MTGYDRDETHPLRKLCVEWIGKINQGIEHRRPWLKIAQRCEMFFSADTGFLWDPKYKHEFWNERDTGPVKPKFQLTIARAFELVALFGPTLYWRNPVRAAEVRRSISTNWQQYLQFLPPQVQQQIQQQMQVQPELNPDYEDQLRQLRADLMTQYLNWTPDILELHQHSELAITQALVMGRGCLWTMPYRPPGSNRVMVGSFFDPVENFVIDPDATSLADAYWIAQRCIEPVWKIERDRQHLGYTPGSLQKYATLESGNQQGDDAADDLANAHRAASKTQDMIVYWKIWSKCGVARLKDLKSSGLVAVDEDLRARLEQVVGDYAYLEVVHDCPFPLNAPTPFLQQATNEQVAPALSWPIPFWKRDRWPISVLDFYARPKKAWPIPPLASGLGELIAMNLLFSHRVSRLWMSQRDFIAYKKSASEELRKIIEEGNDLSFLPLEEIQGNINEVIQFLQQPTQHADVGKVIDELLQMFDRRVGLTDLMYGQQDPQSRSAADVRIREKMVNIRPEFMASKVEEWQSGVAKSEALGVKSVVGADSVMDLFGPMGAMFWQMQIVAQPFDKILHEIDYRVEASSARRPNRDADLSNLIAFTQLFLPIIQQAAVQTGDVGPLNALMMRWGKSAEFDLGGIYVPQPPPPQPPPQPAQEQPGQESAQAQPQAQGNGQQMMQPAA